MSAYSHLLHVGGEPGWRSFVFIFAPFHFLHDHLIKNVNIQLDKHANGGVSIKLSPFKLLLLLRSILTMPCSGTAACTLRLTTWAIAGQCWGGLKPLLGSVALVLLVGTLAGWPRVSYTFMCNRLPCRAALWKISKWMSTVLTIICWAALQYLLLLKTLMVKLYFTFNCDQ